MKKIFLILLSVVVLSVNIFAADDEGCVGELQQLTSLCSPIEVWEEDYQSCLHYEWTLSFPYDWTFVEFGYVIDLNPQAAMDMLMIYIEDENGEEREVLNYTYQPTTGRIVLPLHTPFARIVFTSGYGNNNMFKGFKLFYSQGTANPTDQVFFTNVGIGTYPQETLHVNGAIRGGGTNGEVTLKGDNGSVTIGATDAQTMTFNTDKSKYAFNVNGTNRMLIQSNGNVGIGLSTPYGRLHINGGALRLGVGSSEAARTANVLEFGDNSYVKIGEWQKDNMLSFKAHSFNFNVGNVGIGTTTPQYNLDVAGTIRAEELIVETTGADYVFADDYQLRPLSEVEAFITENKHLPEIQSAQEMQENGVSVSELQTKLLQKIEELTLYILQQEERIQQQELRIKTLEMK